MQTPLHTLLQTRCRYRRPLGGFITFKGYAA
jgi:hypothetical protein